jgi:hypothetical protein
LALAVIGALAVIAYSTFARYPNLAGVLAALLTVSIAGKLITQKLLALEIRDRPPAQAESFFAYLLPEQIRDSVIGDYREVYFRSAVILRTRINADLWYWKEVLSAIIPLLILQARTRSRIRLIDINELKHTLPFYRLYKS